MPATVFNTFAEVQNALQTFVQTNNILIAEAPHKNMWERGNTAEQYTNFVTGQVFLPGTGYPTTGYPILQKGNGKASYIIKALSGPFTIDSTTIQQMPLNGPYLDQDTITAISNWIDAGANLLSYTFDGNSGGVPKNWTQFLDPGGSIVETNDLTITATTGNPTGIASGTTTYDPESVISTIVVVINGINANGNAIFGLIGPAIPSPGGPPAAELGAGIDASGNVFAVALSPGGPSGNPVPFPNPKFSGYSGGETTLSLVINPDRVRVTSGQVYDSGDLLFSGLGNFSLSAFGNVAIPAVVGASNQQGEKGGQARFESITVSAQSPAA